MNISDVKEAMLSELYKLFASMSRNHYNQTQIARKYKISNGYVGKILARDFNSISFEKVYSLCLECGIEVELYSGASFKRVVVNGSVYRDAVLGHAEVIHGRTGIATGYALNCVVKAGYIDLRHRVSVVREGKIDLYRSSHSPHP